MINIFDQLNLPVNAVIGSTEGGISFGNLNPVNDTVDTAVGSYYLSETECALFLKYGPNDGDWTVVNAGSATRSLGAILRTRYTEDLVLTGNDTGVNVPLGTFDIVTAPEILRLPNPAYASLIETGSYLFQYWISVIGDPNDVEIEVLLDSVPVSVPRSSVVAGIGSIAVTNPNSSVSIKATNKSSGTVTIQEFHAIMIKIDIPIILAPTDVEHSTQVTTNTPTGIPVDVVGINTGYGITKIIESGTLGVNVVMSVDPTIIPDQIVYATGMGLKTSPTANGLSFSVDPDIIPTQLVVRGGTGIDAVTVNGTTTVSIDPTELPTHPKYVAGDGILSSYNDNNVEFSLDRSSLPTVPTYSAGYGITRSGNGTNVILSLDTSVLPTEQTYAAGSGLSSSTSGTTTTFAIDYSELPSPVVYEAGDGLLQSATGSNVVLSLDDSKIPKYTAGYGIVSKSDGNDTQLSIDSDVIPDDVEPLVVSDGSSTASDVTRIDIGSGLVMTKQSNGTVTLDANGSNSGDGPAVFCAFSTYTQSISWYGREIVWDMEHRKDSSHFKHGLGDTEVHVLVTGWYEVSFDVTLRTSNSRSLSRSYLLVDGDELDGTSAYGYHRSSSQGAQTSSTTVAVYLVAGSKLAVETYRYSGSSTLYTVAESTRLNIRTT